MQQWHFMLISHFVVFKWYYVQQIFWLFLSFQSSIICMNSILGFIKLTGSGHGLSLVLFLVLSNLVSKIGHKKYWSNFPLFFLQRSIFLVIYSEKCPRVSREETVNYLTRAPTKMISRYHILYDIKKGLELFINNITLEVEGGDTKIKICGNFQGKTRVTREGRRYKF